MNYEYDGNNYSGYDNCCDSGYDYQDEGRECDKGGHEDCEFLGKSVYECKYFRTCQRRFYKPEPKKERCCSCCQKCRHCGQYHN